MRFSQKNKFRSSIRVAGRPFPLPSAAERTLILGNTGSGKSTLAERIVSIFPNAIIIDDKSQIEAPGFKIVNGLSRILRVGAGRYTYRPALDEVGVMDAYDEVFEFVYRRGNTAILIDELYSIAYGPRIPFFLRAILTRGRSRNIACIMCAQSASYLHHFILSQSEIFYIFHLRLPQDRDKIEAITGIMADRIAKLKDYEFLANYKGKDFGKFKLKR